LREAFPDVGFAAVRDPRQSGVGKRSGVVLLLGWEAGSGGKEHHREQQRYGISIGDHDTYNVVPENDARQR
jgi:hypothetical protein